jgi:type II secretory pathway component PulL
MGTKRMIFQSKSVGIDLGPDSIRIAVATLQGGRARILTLLERDISPPAEGEAADPAETVGAALGDAMREIDASDDPWVACLPAAGSINRLLETPLTDSAKIKQTLKFQIEPLIPYPVDQVISDFTSIRKLDEGSEILAVAVAKESVSERLRPLRSAGIDPHILTLDALALADFYITPFDFSEDKITALLLTDAVNPFLGFFAGEKLVGYRSLESIDPHGDPSFAGLIKELRRTLIGFEPSGGGEIGALCVGGRNAETIREYLAEEFRDLPVRNVEFNERRIAEVSPDVSGSVDDYRLAIALARAGLEEPANAVNFMQEEYAPASPLSRLMPSVKFSLIVLGAMLAVWFASVWAQIYGQTRQLKAMNEEMALIFADTMPGARSSSAVGEMIRQKQDEFASLKSYSSEYVSPLDILKELDAAMSGAGKLTLDYMTISSNDLHMTGVADSSESVIAFKKRIESSPLFSGVNETIEKKDKLKFGLRVKVQRPPTAGSPGAGGGL